MITKKKNLLALAIFICSGQIVALVFWFIFKENFIVPMLIGSVVAYYVSYKSEKE